MSEQIPAADTVSKAEYDKAVLRAQTMEGKLTDVERTVEAFKKYGTPEEISGRLADYEAMKKTKAIKNPEELDSWYGDKEKEIRGTVQKDVDTYKTKAEQAESRLKELTLVDAVFGVAASKINSEAQEDVKDNIRKHGDIVDGKPVFKDAEGKILYKPGSTTEPLDSAGFVDWLKTKKPYFFKSEIVKGERDSGDKGAVSHDGKEITPQMYLEMSDSEHRKLPLEARAKLAKGIKVKL